MTSSIVVPTISLAVFCGLCAALFWLVAKAVSCRALGPWPAVVMYASALAAMAWAKPWAEVYAVNAIYNKPEGWVSAQDVGLALMVWLGMYIAWAIALLGGCFAAWWFLVRSRANSVE